MNAPSAMIEVVKAAREVRDANQALAYARGNGSLHDVAEARGRFASALTELDAAFGDDT